VACNSNNHPWRHQYPGRFHATQHVMYINGGHAQFQILTCLWRGPRRKRICGPLCRTQHARHSLEIAEQEGGVQQLYEGGRVSVDTFTNGHTLRGDLELQTAVQSQIPTLLKSSCVSATQQHSAPSL
jgi:hypothetical protein